MSDETLLPLKNGVRVNPAVAIVFWDELRRLVGQDREAAHALYQMSKGNYQQHSGVEDRLREAGFLDDERRVLSVVRNVVLSAVVEQPDGTLVVGLPFDPNDFQAARAWGERRVQQHAGFAQFVEQVRSNQGTGGKPAR